MERFICLLIGYAFGLIQTGYIYGKIKGVDIRKEGSGNAGSTNALRTMGIKAGLVTLLGDCFKCVFAVVTVYLNLRKDLRRHFPTPCHVCRDGCGTWAQLSILSEL